VGLEKAIRRPPLRLGGLGNEGVELFNFNLTKKQFRNDHDDMSSSHKIDINKHTKDFQNYLNQNYTRYNRIFLRVFGGDDLVGC
jgi:chromosome condensin MukBEF MukE localization factor